MPPITPRRPFAAATAALFAGAILLAVGLDRASAASPDFQALIAAPDRSAADRETDKRRNPVQLLAFTDVQTGMKVLDVGAGGGYSTELMARAVGPSGTVYGQDMQARERFIERAKAPAMKNVVHVVRPFGDPVPPEVNDLDLITFFFFYHDVTAMDVDRAAMNRSLFRALKPGGLLIIADHSAKAGDGTAVGKTLHRIEESALRQEVEAAGFRLVGEGDFLRNPSDPRDAPVFKPSQPVDEFVLKFQKPR